MTRVTASGRWLRTRPHDGHAGNGRHFRARVGCFPVTTAFELPGMVVERNLGLVVRAVDFSKAITGGISSLRQGEISQFTVVLEDARRHAIDRMIGNAKLDLGRSLHLPGALPRPKPTRRP